jgi:hypothetical protein
MPAAFFCGENFHHLWPKKLSRATHTKDFKLTLNSKPDDYMVVCNFGWNQQIATHFGSNEPNKYLVLYTNLQWKIEVLNLKTFLETLNPKHTPPSSTQNKTVWNKNTW